MSIAAYDIASGFPSARKMGRDRNAARGGPSHDIQSYALHARIDQRRCGEGGNAWPAFRARVTETGVKGAMADSNATVPVLLSAAQAAPLSRLPIRRLATLERPVPGPVRRSGARISPQDDLPTVSERRADRHLAGGVYRHWVRPKLRHSRAEQRVSGSQDSVRLRIRAREEAERPAPRRGDADHRTGVCDQGTAIGLERVVRFDDRGDPALLRSEDARSAGRQRRHERHGPLLVGRRETSKAFEAITRLGEAPNGSA